MINRIETNKATIPIANILAPLAVIAGLEKIKSSGIRNYKRKRDEIRESWSQDPSDHSLDSLIRDLAFQETEEQHELHVSDFERLIGSLETGLCILFEKHADDLVDEPWNQRFVNKNYRHILDNFYYFKRSFSAVPFSAEDYESKLKTLKDSLEEMKTSFYVFKSNLFLENCKIKGENPDKST